MQRLFKSTMTRGRSGRFVEVEPELTLHADVRLAAESLVAELERRGHQSVGYRRQEVLDAIAVPAESVRGGEEETPGLIDPRVLMIELDRILPENRLLALDAGHFFSFAVDHIRARGPRSLVQLVDAGSIGLGIGAGIGMAVGRPDTPVVVAAGDAGFLMAVADLETAVRYRLPLIVVVCNDNALGAEVHYLSVIGVPTELAEFPTPSLAAVAEAMGAEGFTVTSVDDLAAVAQRLREPLEGPIVLDCLVNPAVRAHTVEFNVSQRQHAAASSSTTDG